MSLDRNDRNELAKIYAEKATLADFYRAALNRWRDVPDAVPEGKLIELRKLFRSDAQAGRALAEYYRLDEGTRAAKQRLVRSALEEFIFEANPANAGQGDEVAEMWALNIRYNSEGDILSVTYPNKVDALKFLLDVIEKDKKAEILSVLQALEGEKEDDVIGSIKKFF